MRKSVSTAVLLALALASALACGKTPAKVAVAPPKANLIGKDASTTFTAAVTNSKGDPLPEVPVTWASSNEAVAAVDAAGKTTPKSTGEATVTATAGKVSGQAKVTVVMVSSIQLALPDPGLAGAAGTQVQLSAKVLDEKGKEHAEVPLTFTSSDPKVATVDKAGIVTLASSGPVTLTVSAGKGAEATLPGDVLIQVPKFFKITKGNMVLKVGESAPVEFEAFDEKGRPCKVPPAFSSSDEKVATVDGLGKVTAVGAGSAEVVLTVGTDKRPVKVTVK